MKSERERFVGICFYQWRGSRFSRWILVPGQEHPKTGGVYLVLALRYEQIFSLCSRPGTSRHVSRGGVSGKEKKEDGPEALGLISHLVFL